MADFKSIDDLLGSTELAVKKVDLTEEWGRNVHVRELDAEAFGIFMQLNAENTDDKGNTTLDTFHIAAVCALSMCDQNGKLLVERKKWNQTAEKLAASKTLTSLSKVSQAAMEVSKFTSEAVEEAGKN